MNITSAEFIKGITGTDGILYNGKFQVVFLGRSNVGKSTLINSLTARENLVRSSSTPGKTIRMDFFLINDEFYFVDFPGVGYAKRSWKKQDRLAKMMLWYLLYSEVKKRLIILILDAKVGLTNYDLEILKILREKKIDYLLIANKIDNLKMSQKEKQLVKIKSESQNSLVIPFSSKKKYGKGELLKIIFSYIN